MSASPHNYRIVTSYDRERNLHVARVPELQSCQGEGPTRAEAIARAEQEIETQIDAIVQRGEAIPTAVDDQPAEQLAAPLQISQTLARELAWQARADGVSSDQLAGELISLGLELRRGLRTAAREAQSPAPLAPRGREQNQGGQGRDQQGNQAPRGGPGPRGERGRGISGARYHGIMEDRANFIEYVRSLENDQGGRGPRRK
jgi:predicted RNase H-like HicB family nuclease